MSLSCSHMCHIHALFYEEGTAFYKNPQHKSTRQQYGESTRSRSFNLTVTVLKHIRMIENMVDATNRNVIFIYQAFQISASCLYY